MKKILLIIFYFIFVSSVYAEVTGNTEKQTAYGEESPVYKNFNADDALISDALQNHTNETTSSDNRKFMQGEQSKKGINKSVRHSVIPNMQSTSIKMIASLSIILSLLFLAAYLLKKYMGGGGVFGKNTLVKVISSSYISAKNYIALIDVAGEVLVVGISNNNISMLTKITDKETLERITGDSAKPNSGKSFFGIFKKISARSPSKHEEQHSKKGDDFNSYMDEAEGKEATIEKLTKTIKDMSNRL